MITPERAETYKKQAIASVASRVKNPLAPGIAMIPVSPHDLLDLLFAFDAHTAQTTPGDADGPQAP